MEAMTEALHPFHRYVALGDSFTEGIGDPDPNAPGGFRGWADRVAEVLARGSEDFAYANLAVRGKLIRQIADGQVDAAVALLPDLITISAGGNDVIRPGTDPDQIGALFNDIVTRLSVTGATIVVFTGVDVGFSPVFRALRGKVAIYNENVRVVAERHGCLVADQWALKDVQDQRLWSVDRLHLNPLGHHAVARMVLDTMGVQHDLQPMEPEPLPARSWRRARVDDLSWAKEYFVPWVVRRVRGVSSGDHILPKRPDPAPIVLPGDEEAAM